MDCRMFGKTIYDYQDGALTASEKAEFELHRSGCVRCSARMEAEAQTARFVCAAVEDACAGLDARATSGDRFMPSRDSHVRSSPIAVWHVAAAVTALLLMALLLAPIVRRPFSERAASPLRQSVPGGANGWTEEITVTYETSLVAETILVSHESGGDSIIEIRVAYAP